MSNLTPAPSIYDMWRAYALAPAVTPLTFLAILAIGGGSLPANVIALGFAACYLVAALIGMPIAFWLRRRGSLNALTIHGAALTWGLIWGVLLHVRGCVRRRRNRGFDSFASADDCLVLGVYDSACGAGGDCILAATQEP